MKKFCILILISILICPLWSDVNRTFVFQANQVSDSLSIGTIFTGIAVTPENRVFYTATGLWRDHPAAVWADAFGISTNTPWGIQWSMSLLFSVKNGQEIIHQVEGQSSAFFFPYKNGTIEIDAFDWMDDAYNNEGALTINITVEDPVIQTQMPGLPVPGGIATSVPVSVSKKSVRGIQGPPLVQEDQSFTWYAKGNGNIFLAPDSKISYKFYFNDPKGTVFSDQFDPYASTDIRKRIRGSHAYLDSGQYNITLDVNLTERVYTGIDFTDYPRTYRAGPFSVMVVDHVPEFIGACIAIIHGPGNTTNRPYLGYRNSDILWEDETDPGIYFELEGLFKFFCELPPGTKTEDSPDRFGGVLPDSVRYTVDFGDGTQASDWKEFLDTSSIKTDDVQNPDAIQSLMSEKICHTYQEPGEYKLKFSIKYQILTYEAVSFNGVDYTWRSKLLPEKYLNKSRKIVVADRTPPRISKNEFVEKTATTGDPLDFEFHVEDNHYKKKLKWALLYIEKPHDLNKFESMTMEIIPTGDSQVCGKTYTVSYLKWIAPEDFATKKKKPKKLRYYIKLFDAEGNINPGSDAVIENTPPRYCKSIIKTVYNNITVLDNDPPDIYFTIETEAKAFAAYSLKEGINDFKEAPMIYAPMTFCNDLLGICGQFPDHVNNPLKRFDPQSIRLCEDPLFITPRKCRFRLKVKVIDRVDGKNCLIGYGFKSNILKQPANKNDFYFIPEIPGIQNFTIIVEDQPNIDDSRAVRSISFPIKILNTTFKTQALESK